MEAYRDLLSQIHTNCKNIPFHKKLSAYNIFDVLEIQSREVIMCRFLTDLLNPEGMHGCGIRFLKSFIRDVLKMDPVSDTLLLHTEVVKEYPIDKERRIDIFIRNAEYQIPIEVKIYAGEQEEQCSDYFEMASKAIAEMFRQNGQCLFDQDGMMTKGVLVRHLVLPGHVKEAKAVIKYLYDTYKDAVYISIMNQYTPVLSGKAAADYPELTRSLTKREYERVVDYAISLGISNAFIQEGDVAKESFIPPFDGEGI